MNTFTDKGTAPFEQGHPQPEVKPQTGVIGESEPSTVEDYERQSELDRYKHIRWLQDAKVGSTDWGGQQITAILNKSDMFLIYRVEGDRDDDALKLFVACKSDDQEKLMADNYDRMQIELLGVYSVMRKSKNPRPLLRKVAAVIAMVIEANPDDAQNKYEDAKLICREIVDQVNKEYNKLIDGKLIYLSGCLFTVALLTSLSVTSVYLKQTEFIIKITTLLPFLYAATFAREPLQKSAI